MSWVLLFLSFIVIILARAAEDKAKKFKIYVREWNYITARIKKYVYAWKKKKSVSIFLHSLCATFFSSSQYCVVFSGWNEKQWKTFAPSTKNVSLNFHFHVIECQHDKSLCRYLCKTRKNHLLVVKYWRWANSVDFFFGIFDVATMFVEK
jgi:hypothetical protein